MVNVQVNTTPTQDIINKANEEFSIEDARGRKIVLKKPKALAQLRLVKALGDLSKNTVYMTMASSLLWVLKIDDAYAPQLIDEKAVEGLWDRLDDEGLEAVGKALQEKVGNKTMEETLDDIKK